MGCCPTHVQPLSPPASSDGTLWPYGSYRDLCNVAAAFGSMVVVGATTSLAQGRLGHHLCSLCAGRDLNADSRNAIGDAYVLCSNDAVVEEADPGIGAARSR